MGAQATVKYHYSYSFLLIRLNGSELHSSFSRIKAPLAGRSVSKTLSGWEFGWGGTSVK